MKIHLPKFLRKWSKKKIIWTIIIILIIAIISWFIFARNNSSVSLQTTNASKQNLEQTVLATGQVVSGTSLELSFQGSGTVKQVYIKEGDKVYAGQTLAILDQALALANLKIAQGSLAQAKANYEKLIAGSTQEDVKIYEDSVTSAKQDLKNSYADALVYIEDAQIKVYNSLSSVANLQNDYFGSSDQEGIIVQTNKNKINTSLNNIKDSLNQAKLSQTNTSIETAIDLTSKELNNISDSLKIIRDVCDQGIYYSKVSSTYKTTIDNHRTYINTATSNIENSQQAISSYKIALTKAESQLALKKAPARDEDIALYKAQIISAQGQVDSAQVAVNNTIISAPVKGTITQVDTKIGQLATATLPVITLQDVDSLHIESDVSEANIAYLKIGQNIDYTFDALGPDKHYAGIILTINPASTVISGIVNYKIKGSLDSQSGDNEDIKPGMTANLTIMVAKKDNTLAIPYSAIINKNKKQYVRLITDAKNKTYKEVEIKTGLQADGGLVEILSGLEDGQEVVTYLKQ